MNRYILLSVTFLLGGSLCATEPVYENGFDDAKQIAPLYQRFKSMKVVDGVLRVEHERGHAASPTLPTPFSDGVFRFRFKLDGAERLGYSAIEGRVHIHDFHAAVLHLLGLDHERLTFLHAGRPYRLTDVYGKVVREILT